MIIRCICAKTIRCARAKYSIAVRPRAMFAVIMCNAPIVIQYFILNSVSVRTRAVGLRDHSVHLRQDDSVRTRQVQDCGAHTRHVCSNIVRCRRFGSPQFKRDASHVVFSFVVAH